MQDAEAAVARAQDVAEERRRELEIASTNLELARRGLYYTGDRGDGGEPAKVARQLREIDAAIAVERARITALEAELRTNGVVSPCECTLHQVLRSSGEWVEAGTPVLVLTAAEGDILIEAQVPQDQVVALRLYQTAYIKRGRVVRIEREGAHEPRAGLPPALRGSFDAANVLVAPVEPLPRAAVGIPATVLFPLSLEGVIGRWFGRL